MLSRKQTTRSDDTCNTIMSENRKNAEEKKNCSIREV